jgi:hypothetical protein
MVDSFVIIIRNALEKNGENLCFFVSIHFP